MRASQREPDREGFVIRIPVIKIPWDSNTVRGFACAILIICLFVSISPFIKISQPKLASADTTALPLNVLLQLKYGMGDKPGRSGGNLQAEGAKAQSQTRNQRFDDASSPKHASSTKTARPGDPKELSSNVKPAKNVKEQDVKSTHGKSDANTTTKNNTAPENSSMASGDRTTATDGSGKGRTGTGSGSGLGFDIHWDGGGGNVLVLNKSIPRPPQGLNNSTIVRLKFVVDKNGDVESVIPLTRGAPQAESAALKAMWLWKFRVKNEQRAEGVIKFTFDVN